MHPYGPNSHDSGICPDREELSPTAPRTSRMLPYQTPRDPWEEATAPEVSRDSASILLRYFGRFIQGINP